jgi:hypothetical protein
MEATHSSETSLHFQRTTWRYMPEDSTFHSHRCENPKFYKKKVVHHLKFTSLICVQKCNVQTSIIIGASAICQFYYAVLKSHPASALDCYISSTNASAHFQCCLPLQNK